MDLGNCIDILGFGVGDPIGLTKCAFHLNRDCSDGQNYLDASRHRLISLKIGEPAIR